VSTQLRLVDAPATRKPKSTKAAKSSRSRVAPTGRNARRAVNWGDWRLDATTRSVGRAGVARARRALEEAAAAEELSQAS
jgi:hypothetical protein